MAQGDSTSAAGWMRKSNFDDDSPLQLRIARAIARRLMETKCALHSLWFAGIENEVADCLSRDFHLTDDEIVALLSRFCPNQLPQGFRICRLPRGLSSQVTSWLASLPPATQSPTTLTRSKLAIGAGTWSTSTPLSSATTPSSSPSTSGPVLGSSAVLSPPTATSDSGRPISEIAIDHQFRAHAAVPPTLWLRPSGLTIATAPSTMNKESLSTFYATSCEAIPTWIQLPSLSRPLHQTSSASCTSPRTAQSWKTPLQICVEVLSSLQCIPVSIRQ